MSDAVSIDAYYTPGMKGISPQERVFLEEHHPHLSKTEGGTFFHDDLHTCYHISRADKEKAVVIGLSGLNTEQLMTPRDTQRLNDNGITLIWMTLPRPHVGRPFMQDFEKLSRAFLTSPSSPVFGLLSNDVPFFLAAHSTGGTILLKLMQEQDTRRKLSAAFLGAAYVAPFLDVPFASDEHSFKIGSFRPLYWLFEKYADKHSNERVIDLPIVKRYLKLMKKGRDFLNTPIDTCPTLGQIREIQAYSRTMRKTFDPKAAGTLRSVFMAGASDPFTCFKTTKSFVEKIPGANFEPAYKAGHDPIFDRPELLQKFIDHLNSCTSAYEQRRGKRVALHLNPALPHEISDDALKTSGLRDRARLALQRRASALDTFTRFF
jgi:alpha-beta hydrolase superfamily lysophospholipase